MARLRLFGTVLYYLAFIYGVQQAILWVDPAAYETLGGRAFAFWTGLFSFLLFGFVSEVYDRYQGLRSDLFDFLLGDDDAR